MFAADDAFTWRAMWQEWNYSLVVEYALQKARWQREKNEELNELLSDVKDPMTALIIVLMQKT